ncbi:MAG: hypothetical protein L6427_07005, partial [Actinomycetia bacterium]|nr:hypothetical protein [Actinomycetes bacterium]
MRPSKHRLIILTTLLIMTAYLLMPATAPQAALAGTTWTNISSGGMSGCWAASLAYDSAHNLLYAGTSRRGVWKYDGTTWADTGGRVSSYDIRSLTYDSAHNLLYSGCYDTTSFTGKGVWKYDGATWTDTGGGVSSYSIESLAYDSVHNVLYAGVGMPPGSGVWKYDGATWTDISSGGMSGYSASSLAYDSVHNVLYEGMYSGVWKYDGATWTAIGAGSYYDIESLAYDSVHNVLYAGTQGDGVWKYDGATWTYTGEGGPPYDFYYSLAYDSAHSVLYAGTGNFGVRKYDGATWADTGEGMTTATNSLAYDSAHNVLYAAAGEEGVWKYSGSDPTPSTYYLAEGSTAWMDNCSEYISIENPNSTAVNAQLTYMVQGSGSVTGPTVVMPPNSQATVNPAETVGRAHFSTKVECKEGKTIAVDRTMSWTGPGASSPEGHCSVGVTSPAKTWYLPEGSSDWGFECWLLIQNPNDTEATATVTYMIE